VLNREPLQVLVLLIEHAAEEVPREQIQKSSGAVIRATHNAGGWLLQVDWDSSRSIPREAITGQRDYLD
jgi:hypothetical protein